MVKLWLFTPRTALKFVLGIMLIAVGLGFIRYLGQTVTLVDTLGVTSEAPFPVFPNILDSIFIVAAGFFMLYEVIKEHYVLYELSHRFINQAKTES